jgi:uncharacterized phage infection (PIP) family protein YhgE
MIKKYKPDEKFGYDKLKEKLEKIKKKYDEIINGLDNTSDEYNKLKARRDKYNDKLTQLNGKLAMTNGADNLGPNKYGTLSDLCSDITKPIIELFNDLQDGTGNNNPELTHFIFGKLLMEYNEFQPLFRGENVHLYLSGIYDKILSEGVDVESYNDIKQLEQILGKLCLYLDQRYMEDSKIEENVVLKNIVESIILTSLITLQNSFILNLKKIIVNHIITNYGFDKIDEYKKMLDKLMDKTNGILNFMISKDDSRENLTSEYVKLKENTKFAAQGNNWNLEKEALKNLLTF